MKRLSLLAVFVVFFLSGAARLAANEALFSDPPPVVSVASDMAQSVSVSDGDWVEELTYTTRAPIGHTHTDARGHTWDHSANPGHTCTVAGCGLSQYVQDSYPRPVTVAVRRMVFRPRVHHEQRYTYDPSANPPRVVAWHGSFAQPAFPAPAYAPTYTQGYQFQSFGGYTQSGGCANGQCESGSSTRLPRLFGRR